MKINPNKIVIIIACLLSLKLFFKIAWCAHVTLTPEDNKIIVFKRGICMGLKGSIEVGGQETPTSIVGLKLLWKKAQKNEKKKKISETINKIIPNFMFLMTLSEWWPWRVASRVTSRHHNELVIIIIVKPIKINFIDNVWNHLAKPKVKNKAPNEAVKGHGLFSTKWKGWFWFDI